MSNFNELGVHFTQITSFTVSDFKHCCRILNTHKIVNMQISIFTEITSWLHHYINPHLCCLQ